jgi:histone acetyltransferase MYST1
MEEKRIIEPLEIGDICQVLWRDGETSLLASIVERRVRPKNVKIGEGGGGGGGGGREAMGGGGGNSPPPAKRSKAIPPPSSTVVDVESSSSSPSPNPTMTAGDYQYYVHYVEHDRRLDEWVTIDRFDVSALVRHSSTHVRADYHGRGEDGVGWTIAADGGGGMEKSGSGGSSPGKSGDAGSLGGGGREGGNGRGRPPGRRSSSDGIKVGSTTSDGGIATGGRGRRGRPALGGNRSSSSSSLPTSTGAAASSPPPIDDGSATGGGGGGVAPPTNHSGASNTDTMLRSGGNWHGSSGNPDLAELEAEHHEITKVKNITQIVMGEHLVEAWYYSPFPPPYHQVETMFICEFCLKYMRKPRYFLRHRAECPHRSPPGDEIYREGRLSVFELDGKDHRVYCQNLCLLAKLFLDHKTLYYDVDPFYFYVITEVDANGAHIVGYFSKEKVSAEEYNLACILTFPQYQKCGYGKFIISLSYELSKREGKPGSPEKPLSDLGKISYRSYWTHVLLTLFSEQTGEENIQIKDISLMTGIKTEDIISTLQSLNMIRFWKGQHVVFVMQDFLNKYMAQKKKIRLCDERCLTWTPHAERKKGG